MAREVTALVEPVLHVAQSAVHLNPSTAGVVTMLWLLGMSCLCVPLVSMLPGGSPVLGFLIGGLLLGPHCLGIIQDVHGVQHLAEFGVIFLLFNIGLELSLERLVTMAKYVYGMGYTKGVSFLRARLHGCVPFGVFRTVVVKFGHHVFLLHGFGGLLSGNPLTEQTHIMVSEP